MKRCSLCKAEKPRSEFWANRGDKTGLQSRCKPCALEAARVWRKANPSNVRAHDRKKTLRRRYGPDAPQVFAALMEAQEGRCAVCRESEVVIQRSRSGTVQHLAVDHDRESGEIRGLLCFKCNRALGVVGDTLPNLMRFVRYLEDPPARRISRNG